MRNYFFLDRGEVFSPLLGNLSLVLIMVRREYKIIYFDSSRGETIEELYNTIEIIIMLIVFKFMKGFKVYKICEVDFLY